MLSHNCRQKRLSQGYAQDGPLLAAILKAEQEAGTLPQHPTPKTPAPLAAFKFSLKAGFGQIAGVCPKEGCGLRAGRGSSRTHCCRRCEMAHLHGKPRLDRDPGPGPSTGELWQKSAWSRMHRARGPKDATTCPSSAIFSADDDNATSTRSRTDGTTTTSSVSGPR